MKLIFKNKKPEAKGIYSWQFASQLPVSWLAGQSIRLELETDYMADERRFTISSPPSQQDIEITTTLTGSHFKQALGKLKPGDEISAHGIEGDFVWPSDSPRSLIFLANGLGITPFRSQIAEQINSGQSPKAMLLYSYKSEAAIFKTEFDAWQKTHPELDIEYLPDHRLTADLARQLVPEILLSTIYISGSSKFVNSLARDLIENYKVKPDNIKLDEFTGLAS